MGRWRPPMGRFSQTGGRVYATTPSSPQETQAAMRFGIDARLVYYSKAGIGQYIIHLVEGLAEIDPENEYLLLQSRKDRSIITNHSNFQRVTVWTPSHHRFEQFALYAETLRLGLDLLHSPDFIPPRHIRCKSVITVHDLAFLLYPHFLTREAARFYGHIDQAVRWADHIIADSENTKQDTMEHLGVPEDKITVVHVAADPAYQPVNRETARAFVQQAYGLDGPYLLFVSTIEPRKNLPTLLHGLRQLLDCYRVDAKLVVVGSKGWLWNDSLEHIELLGLEEDVRVLGRVPTPDLVQLYNAAEALVHPAFYEGFGLTPLEAMLCGTPVVASNVASIPEVVGDAALLIDPNNVDELAVSLWRVLTDSELREEMISKGFRQAQRFSWERAARETLDIYIQTVRS
jgi:glycosyltransferase involved in cell wall biosynthesis